MIKYEIATSEIVIILIVLAYYMLVKTIRTLKRSATKTQKYFRGIIKRPHRKLEK